MVRWWRVWAVGGIAMAALGLCTAAFGGEAGQKGLNAVPPGEKQVAKSSPAAEGAAELSLAYQLVRYGRRHRSPESLIVAAQILGSVPVQQVQEKPTTKKEPNAPAETKPKTTKPADDRPQALLAEARAMSSAPHIATLADAVAHRLAEKPRGAAHGPHVWSQQVSAHSTDVYRIVFRGGEPAIVVVSGDGDTDLDLYVHDENGNLIAVDDDMTDDCIVRWTPRWTGPFTIRIVNRGSVYNQYRAAHN